MEVACAIIINNELLFIAKRPLHKNQGGKWEFPGGKKLANESIEDCIIREISEELNITVSIVSKLNPITHQYPTFQIYMTPFICRVSEGTIKLGEHIDSKWIQSNNLQTIDFCEADKKIIPQIVAFFKR